MRLICSFLIMSLTTVFMTSCTKSNDDNSLNRFAKNIVSTRAQNSTHFIAVLKLKNPALFETSNKSNGRAVVDEKLLKVIQQEQQEALVELKKISTEVQVIYTYKMVLNGIAILAPIELTEKIKNIGTVAYIENVGNFERPVTFAVNNSIAKSTFAERNSAKFIGAEKLNQAGIRGQGIKVGVIDTGIDYTHAMFGGEGTEAAFSAVNPLEASTGYPNKKVVGGIDLVGTTFDSGSVEFANHIPKPDSNPIDEAGHGTHVAGTVAGIGDGVNSYNGMAPDADLFAIKVFGAKGSTSDCVVIAALEFSADPNNDGNNQDQLDVVNLSLGSSYGNPHILYTEAIKNLSNGGTVVVASAGNSGHQDYIVGAPGTSEKALSVAASIDDSEHLWRFNASRINLGSENLLVEAIEAATTKKIQESDPVSGKFVYLGLVAQDLTEEEIAAVRGHVALIDRGQVSFNDKIKRAAAAGVIGVVVVNNSPSAPIAMGTTDKFEFPAIMISQADGNKIKEVMKTSDVVIDFKTEQRIEKPELIDTLTDFTSKGPRSVDGFIKPEISAPGENIISARIGGGNKTVPMSGTSMAAPHMAGVMALLKQAHKALSSDELKSLIMGTTKTIGKKGDRYPISMQGSGRVQADKAVESKILVMQASISLGEIGIETKKVMRRYLEIKNISDENIDITLTFDGSNYIQMSDTKLLAINSGKSVVVPLDLLMNAAAMKEEKIREMDGWIKIMLGGKTEIYRVPVLAVAHKLSSVEAKQLVIRSTSDNDASGAIGYLKLSSKNANNGEALLFNLIGQDSRKPKAEDYMTSDCDLQSAGYRIVTDKDSQNQTEDRLQIAIKLYKPMTTWQACDISLLIDSDLDGVPEQELLGSSLRSIPGQKSSEFATTLIDATRARLIRKEFEKAIKEAAGNPEQLAKLKQAENYKEALVEQKGMKVYNNSSIVILEISTKNLALTHEGVLAFKVLATHGEQSSVEFDDYLNSTVETDMKISLKKLDQSFLNLPGVVKFSGNQEQTVELTKGDGKEKLLVLYPYNKFSMSDLHEDSQAQIMTPIYKVDSN